MTMKSKRIVSVPFVQLLGALLWLAANAADAQTSTSTITIAPVSPSPSPNASSSGTGVNRLRTVSAALMAQTDAVSVAFLQGKQPAAPDAIGVLGPDLFGDKINLFNGSFSFEQTDVELPGNSALQVAVVRQHTPGRKVQVRGAMGDWDLNTPRIEGTFATSAGWVPALNTAAARCSAYAAPPAVTAGAFPGVDFQPWEYGQGINLVVPGAASQEVLLRNASNSLAPTDGKTYRLVTREHWQIGCLSTVLNGSGEGFTALSPDGTRYLFNWMASRRQSPLVRGNALLTRSDMYLMATSVTDRFGNWVRYTYDAANPLNLTRIESSDQRVITLTYANGRVASVFDGTRTWLYTYTAQSDLQAVQLPDRSRWQFNLSPLIYTDSQLLGETLDCDSLADTPGGTFVGSMTHPSGATGTFSTRFLPHGRTNVQRACTYDPASGWTTGAMVPKSTSNQALISKQISGPGMPTMTWAYSGDSNSPYGEWTCAVSSSCPDRKFVLVTEPSGAVTRYTYGIRWQENEGQLLRLDNGWNGSSALRTTTYSYRGSTGMNFPNRFGNSVYFSSDHLSTRNRPLELRVITQQGVTFSWQADLSAAGFDAYARPATVRSFSSLGHSRTHLTQYDNNTALWVLGQLASLTELTTNQVVESHTYASATALRTASFAYGLLRNSFAYNADGTLATLFDATGRPTVFQNYMRGQPQRAVFADQSIASRVINNLGNVASYTSEVGTTTLYGFDDMGRLASVTYPGGDALPYNQSLLSFVPMPNTVYGLAAGHWRQTIATGNGRTERYFDALWRKRLEVRYDATQVATTSSFRETRYDAGGRVSFESYPESSFAGVDVARAGRSMSYDALDRPVLQRADSELGLLNTSTQYLASGFQRQVTNPRGHTTRFAFQAFDSPSEDRITQIWAPLDTNMSITRDVFGKPQGITRAGGGLSVTRSYAYDSHQRLCKTLEPETGATVQQLDPIGNVLWRASGLALPGATSCDWASVPAARKVSFGYDARNRVTSTSYGDGSPGVARGYTADGLVRSVSTNTSSWLMSYNNGRHLVAETLSVPGLGTYAFGYGINANGHVASMVYPGNVALQYDPDALGRPRQISGFVGGVTHHPDGQLASYTAANGVSYTMTRNLRGLPALRRHAGVVQDAYSYDANGNVTGITDQQQGLASRSMGYDALDRLSVANGLWGAGQFSYDALDNLRFSQVGARSLTHLYDGSNRLTSVSGSISASLAYDLNGNVVSRAGQGYTFDIGNRLTSATNIASHIYDGNGRRGYTASTNGRTTLRAYSQAGQLLYSVDSVKGTTMHLHLAGQVVAEANSLTGTRWLHTDALGSPVAATGSNGVVQGQRTQYEPYGLTAAGAAPDGIGYTGHVNDVDTGLVYMQQRYYDPIAGRFLSVDPVTTSHDNGNLFNRYKYAENNPYRFTDPDGRCSASRIGAEPGSICGGSAGGLPTGTIAAHQAALAQQLSSAARGFSNLATAGASQALRMLRFTPQGMAAGRILSEGANSEDKPSLLDPKGETHVLDGDKTGGGHRSGTGKPGKSEFPSGWSDDRIKGEISDVATDPASSRAPGRGGREVVRGTRGGIDIEVIVEPNGRIVTGYPTNVPRNPR